MQEPGIQYAATSDGVNIAYYTVGSGAPLVFMSALPVSHLQAERELPGARESIQLISQMRTFVRYNHRGFGLSDRGVSDFSLDAMVRDLESVIDRLDFDRFQLLAYGISAPAALAYAARHPGQLSHLVIVHGHPQGIDPQYDQMDEILALGEKNWELTSETIVHSVLGWWQGDVAHQFAKVLRESTTPRGLIDFIGAVRTWDVSPLLPKVQAPTLILTRPDGPFGSPAAGPRLAAAIPDARLVPLRGTGMPAQDPEETAAIWEFLFNSNPIPRPVPELPQNTMIILFADIVDSTTLTEELGDAGFRSRARDLDESMRSIVRSSSGTPVEGKLLGDGMLAVFTSARQAVDCAIRCNNAAERSGLQLRIGVHAGDVIYEGDNVYGGAVNIAARITSACAPEEILASEVVRGLARTSSDVVFDPRGKFSLKGVADEISLFAVHPPAS